MFWYNQDVVFDFEAPLRITNKTQKEPEHAI